jgi:DNA-binding NtrC family response regulator
MPHVLIVDDDAGLQEALGAVVTEQGFSFDSARTIEAARSFLGTTNPDLILLDLNLPDGQGLEILESAAASPADVVLITGNATVDSAVTALRQGAVDFLVKPVDLARLQIVLSNVATRCELRAEVETLRSELRVLGRFGPLIGSCPAMQEVYDAMSLVAPTDATVLILGDSGTGKELVAQAIHQLSRRRKHPFVAVNCGAISPQLIESELFGHERGSFTGANRAHRGFFERAGGGTLFLDEITEMPIDLQVRLLRVLETGTITRVGGEEETTVDVRILAASNRDPHEAVRAEKLRQDLLYRLSVFPLKLPPLQARGTDIALLAQCFLDALNAAEGKEKRLSPAARQALVGHAWPGNVRELKNVMERAFIVATDDEIGVSCFPLIGGESAEAPVGAAAEEARPTAAAELPGDALLLRLGISISEAEKRLILATLDACDGNKERAAGILSISLKTLYNRLNEYKAREADENPSGGS